MPPKETGAYNREMLATCHELGITEVYRVGGAQAIAAMAFGTESVPAVMKIMGPGNAFVNEAKRQVFGPVGIDQLAGAVQIIEIVLELMGQEEEPRVLKDLGLGTDRITVGRCAPVRGAASSATADEGALAVVGLVAAGPQLALLRLLAHDRLTPARPGGREREARRAAAASSPRVPAGTVAASPLPSRPWSTWASWASPIPGTTGSSPP